MLDIHKILTNGLAWHAHISAMRAKYDQPAITYPPPSAPVWTDVPYAADSERQKFNVYLPEGRGPFPAVIWVHGGGWYTGDRADRWLASVLPLTKHGFALVSVGYRLADEAVFPAPVEDVVRAVEQIVRTGNQYGIDTTRVGIIGGSAGANLAANAAVRCSYIKAAIILCAPLDFSTYQKQFSDSGLLREGSTMPEEDTSFEAMYLGGSILDLPEFAVEANPANHLSSHPPHFLLIHGTADTVVPYMQSVSFQQAVNRTANDEMRATLISILGGDHDSPALDQGGLFERKATFLRQYI